MPILKNMPHPFDVQKYVSLLGKQCVTIFLFHGVIEEQLWSLRNYTKKHLLKHDFIAFLQMMKKTGCRVIHG